MRVWRICKDSKYKGESLAEELGPDSASVPSRNARSELAVARAGLLQGWPLARQLDFACAAAALNCQGAGARGGIESVDAIENLMATGSRHDSALNMRHQATNAANSVVYVSAHD